MTREQWKALAPAEQRIKVAELCGWKLRNMFTGNSVTILIAVRPVGATMSIPYTSREELSEDALPDYIGDLNAMHEAEELLHSEDHCRIGDYTGNLTQVMGAFNASWMWTFATAAQRAEAFVLTMDKGDQTGPVSTKSGCTSKR